MFVCVRYDKRGVFSDGRGAEVEAHRAAGAIDPSLGRIFEGHCNGVLLVSLFGTAAQRDAFERDVADGHLSGVWNTQDTDPVRIRKRPAVTPSPERRTGHRRRRRRGR